jgi:adenylate cyclase
VACAVEIQRSIAQRDSDPTSDGAIRFRIGINLGDVISEDDDIFGDGVNVAARLQELAEPGGICVSGAIRDQAGDRLGVEFEDLGEQSVKNLTRPIRVFRVCLDEHGTAAAPARANVSRPKSLVSTVTDKPSIAVLPFVNMSGDPEQEFFADGLTEDIITALSRFRDLFVISRNSAFVYKNRAVRIQEVAAELGVHYVVEGSVRKVGRRVRVTVQLIDAESDCHVWAALRPRA